VAIITLRPPYSNGADKNTPQIVRGRGLATAGVRTHVQIEEGKTASVRLSHTKHLVINT